LVKKRKRVEITEREGDIGYRIGGALATEGPKRVLEFFIKSGNKPKYYNEIFRAVGGSKTTVSQALHSLTGHYKLLEKEYRQIPANRSTDRMISVLMFKIKDQFFDSVKHYVKVREKAIT